MGTASVLVRAVGGGGDKGRMQDASMESPQGRRTSSASSSSRAFKSAIYSDSVRASALACWVHSDRRVMVEADSICSTYAFNAMYEEPITLVNEAMERPIVE